MLDIIRRLENALDTGCTQVRDTLVRLDKGGYDSHIQYIGTRILGLSGEITEKRIRSVVMNSTWQENYARTQAIYDYLTERKEYKDE